MRTYKPKLYINPKNKIKNYIKFTKKDKVIRDFIDYMAFYGQWERSRVIALLSSDNAPSLYVGNISIDRDDTARWFKCYGSYSYMWFPVRIFRLWEIQIWWKLVLKVDLYWKWLELIRKEFLWENIRKIFIDYLWMNEIITTRIDYTVDCAVNNFNKKNTLKTKIRWKMEVEDTVEYKIFGRKGSSARFLRYYDKKKEIEKRWTQWLYPEYWGLNQIMRYELQVNSDWLDKYERIMKIDDLKRFITFDFSIGDNQATHKKLQHKKDESLFEWIKYWIQRLQRENDELSLHKIKLLLFTAQELCNMDSLAWCETSGLEKPLVLS